MHSAATLGALPVPAFSASEYGEENANLDQTLKRLRVVVVAAPVALVGALELARTSMVGQVDLATHVLLDGLAAAGLIGFGFLMLRAVGRVHDRVKRQNRELLALHAAGLAITSDLSLESVLDKVVERARELAGARYGALSVVDDSGHIEKFITSGISSETRAAIGAPPVGQGLLGVVLQHGQHLRLTDISQDPRRHGFPANHPTMHSLLAVPIAGKSPFHGNLYLSEKEDGSAFTQEDEETLDRFAVHAAIAIDNAWLHRQVADLAIATERIRIAHEVHDGIAQVLGYVNTKVQAANAYIQRGNTEDATKQLRELAVAAREAYGDVRESIVDLRTLPSSDRTFSDLLQDYVSRWNEQTGINTSLTVEPSLALRAGVELQLVRIVQESLTNIRKHARARNVSIDVRRSDGRLGVIIRDDGIGFNPATRSRAEFPRFGLTTMRERAESVGGSLNIESSPGQGTVVRADLPGGE
jgi:signal transduction histidine kinase